MSTRTYQPRFVAYAAHLGMSPDAVIVAGRWHADFMGWISAQWSAWSKATGRDRHCHTAADHDDFDRFLATGSAA